VQVGGQFCGSFGSDLPARVPSHAETEQPRKKRAAERQLVKDGPESDSDVCGSLISFSLAAGG
jgi:hypothetical protein